VSSINTTTDITIGGIASTTNSHCQPASPPQPSSRSSCPETIGPMISEITLADWKNAIIRERYREGNHQVRYSTMPG
jgi:hypothetical protein